GDGVDGRIKYAVGIGTLLEDGLGDTIRVSLTEEPEKEAPVAIALANRYKNRKEYIQTNHIPEIVTINPSIEPSRYESDEVNAFLGGTLVARASVDISQQNCKDPYILQRAGNRYHAL